MKLILLLIAVAAFPATMASAEDNVAVTSYYDSKGKMNSVKLPYIIDPAKIQYGAKFGITVYHLEVNDCRLDVSDELPEYFAACIALPDDCDPIDVVKDAIAQGADFVFINLSRIDDYSALVSKTFDVPVFPMDKIYDEDVFKLGETEYGHRYINVEFIIVT